VGREGRVSWVGPLSPRVSSCTSILFCKLFFCNFFFYMPVIQSLLLPDSTLLQKLSRGATSAMKDLIR